MSSYLKLSNFMRPSQMKNIPFPIHFHCNVGNCSSVVPSTMHNLTSPIALTITDSVVLILTFRVFSFKAARLACCLVFTRNTAGMKMRREQKNEKRTRVKRERSNIVDWNKYVATRGVSRNSLRDPQSLNNCGK